MQYRRLGSDGPEVSRIGLGTMTFGEQNTADEAFAQLDCAVAAGVNLIDAAEMYPVPPRAETQGRTEAIIGDWLQRRGGRERLVIATKVSGRSANGYTREGEQCLDRRNIDAALEASLRRLGTDYIDLYQVHWPDRPTNYFGRLGYVHQDVPSVPIEDTLDALARHVQAGRVRCIGLSNETPWGVMRYVMAAAAQGLPRPVSIQNPYNLLNRTFEVGLAEVAHREQVPLLAYSPLGFGVLTGKYLDGDAPPQARLNRFQQYQRYSGAHGQAATRRYAELARDHGLDPGQMALAYVLGRPFLASALVGATTLAQLESNLAAGGLELPDPVLDAIEAIHGDQPNPCP